MVYFQAEVNGHQVLIRSLRPSDAEPIASYWHSLTEADAQVLAVDRTQLPHKATIIEQMKRLSSQTDHSNVEEWAIMLDVDNQAAAMALVTDIDAGEKAELQFYILEKKYRRKGVSRSVADEVTKIIFEMFDLKTLWARPSTSNQPAIALLEALGVENCGTQKATASPPFIHKECSVYCWKRP